MTTTDVGTIVEVSTIARGDELAVDAAVGTTTLVVTDAADFAEDGGTLAVIGADGSTEVIDYIGADDETSTLTLVTPLAVGRVIGDRVELSPQSLDKTAQVMLGDFDETVQAVVPHALWDKVPDGIRDEGTGETVDLELIGTEYVVTEVVAAAPVVDGTYIDPATIPANAELGAELDQLQLDLTGLDTALHGTGGVDEQLATLDTDLHGVGGLDEQLAGLNTDLHGTGGVDAQLAGLTTDLHGVGGVDEQLSTLTTDLGNLDTEVSGILPITETDIQDGAITTPKMTANTISGDRIAANTLNASKIVAGSISTDRMTANTISGDRIAANTLNASKIVAGSITTDRMTANSISGDRITANTLDAAKIVAGSITTDRMTANTISGDRIATNTLDAGRIVAGSIGTDRMTANTISGDRIAANTLDAAKIVAGSITTDRMTANTISGDRIAAGTLDAAKIVAGSITTDRMTANSINGDRITGGTIAADKLSATAIDGKTITGAYVRTRASGTRVELGVNPADVTSTADELRFYYSTQTTAAGRIFGYGTNNIQYETKDNLGTHKFIGGITSQGSLDVTNGITVGTGGRKTIGLNWDATSVTTNLSGRVTIPHGLGGIPVGVWVTSYRSAWQPFVYDRNISNIVIEIRGYDGTIQPSQTGTLAWLAMR